MSPGERESAMDIDDVDGYVLVRPLFAALTKFEQSEPGMKLYFPDLVRSIDVATEQKRVAALKFAPGGAKSAAIDAEILARHRAAAPTTIPNDAETIAALTEGERRIAEKNPRAAEASFQKVLVKYPDQPRAWFGLGVVAMMEQDGPRAKEVFGRLTSGDRAATEDPLVLAWSHVHLGTILRHRGPAGPREIGVPSGAGRGWRTGKSQAGGYQSARRHGPYQISGTPVNICATCPLRSKCV